MAHSDKNILITPNIGSTTADPRIVFSGANASLGPQNITLQVYPTSSGTLSFEGSAGQLFSITNSMTGTIFSANDVSGIPSIEVLDTGLVKLAQYSGNVLIGTGTDTGTDKLQVNGSILGTTLKGSTLTSSVATGTAPLTVASTTVVPNLNADLVDGLNVHTGTNNEANRIVRTDLNGYIQAGWINTISGDNGTTAIDRVYASSDGYIRYYSPANFRTVLDVPTRTGGSASGTWGINVTGNAATATKLQTARTINGISFDGSANITVPSVLSWSRKTTTYTAVAGDMIIGDTAGGAFTITLPASPSIGTSVKIADGANWATTNLTVARNGSTIEGLSEDLVLNVNGVSVELVYDGSTWELYTFAAPAVAAAVGGGTDQVFFENGTQVMSNYSISSSKNAMSAGPITINNGVTVTVPNGSTWTVV